MSEQFDLYTADKSLPPSGYLNVHSPFSGQEIGRVAQCGEAHIDNALAAAYTTFRDKKQWLRVDERCAILEKCAAIMQDKFEELAAGAAAEGGKPLIDSRVEVARAIDGIHICIETIRTHAGDVIPMTEKQPNTRRVAFTQKEPIGVVVAVSAFNHPLNLIVHQVGAAIAAGCPTLVKPASSTPLSCFRFVDILRQSGLPEHWCQVLLPESSALSTRMVTDPRVAFFSFIGSARVGWMLKSKLAPGARCALEHGGVAPLIVDASADLDKVVPSVLKGGFYHAGQVCVSVQRVYVHESLLEETISRLQSGAEKLIVGDPLSDETEVGPLIDASEVTRIHTWVEEAVHAGAKLITGGQALGNQCYQPSILLNPPLDCQISQQEVFGPVICIYSFTNSAEAIAQANGLDVAFQAAVFAQDIDRAMALAGELDASAVMINDNTAFRQDAMPFAGLRHSGMGVGGIPHTIEDMQIDKMMVIKASV